jgi:hypothetical protein
MKTDRWVEGGDQSTLSLPGDQDRLIKAVATPVARAHAMARQCAA